MVDLEMKEVEVLPTPALLGVLDTDPRTAPLGVT